MWNSRIFNKLFKDLHGVIFKIIEDGNWSDTIKLIWTFIDSLLEVAPESEDFFIKSNCGWYKIIWSFWFRSAIDHARLVVRQHGQLTFIQLVVVEAIATISKLWVLGLSVTVLVVQSLTYMMVLFLL